MKKFLLLFYAVFFAIGAYAQSDTTYWTHNVVAGANMSQVSLSNWTAGGEGSLAFDLNFSYGLDYKRGKNLWNNRLELAYGLNNASSTGTRKTNDKIYLSSMYSYQIAKKWYISAYMNFSTQFAKGYNYGTTPKALISRFMAPGYLTAGVGATWVPNKWLKVTISPTTWRGTFVLDDDLSDAGAYGVDPGKKFRNEFGGNISAEAKFNIMENIGFYSRLDLFSNYLDKPQNVDINWDAQINMKVNRWVSANLHLNMIYDDNAIKRIQFKEVLGVGLQVTF